MREHMNTDDVMKALTRELEKAFGHHPVINTDNFGVEITESKPKQEEEANV